MALYGLKQAPRVWYKILSIFLIENEFTRGHVDTTLFRTNYSDDFILVQIYIDDIIFCATNESLCKEFSSLMKNEFEMSMMGKFKFFLCLQIKQAKDHIYIHQTKYARELFKKFNIEDAKEMKTPMHPNTSLGPRKVV